MKGLRGATERYEYDYGLLTDITDKRPQGLPNVFTSHSVNISQPQLCDREAICVCKCSFFNAQYIVIMGTLAEIGTIWKMWRRLPFHVQIISLWRNGVGPIKGTLPVTNELQIPLREPCNYQWPKMWAIYVETTIPFKHITGYMWYKTPACGSFYEHGLTLIPAWKSNYMPSKVCIDIPYPLLNFNGCTVEVWEWISHFITHFTGHVITYPCWD